jgi:uncharacterized membrane protein YgdD (TMEM256/DUF423 family)
LTFLRLGAASALIAVAAGAFGAHALRARLAADMLAVFETAARYQMYHALALCIVSLLAGRAARAAGWLFVWGTVMFSGSLYLMALTGERWLGAVTPVGGAAFIAGWGWLALGAMREHRSHPERSEGPG